MKGFMESFNHPFGKEACKKRLLEEYKKYGKLIVAFDYDNTIFDYHNNGGDYSCVIELLKRCARLGFELVLFTCDEDISESHRKSTIVYDMLGLAPDGELQINQSSVLPKSYKPYYNILLDDRAGLEESYEILKYVEMKLLNLINLDKSEIKYNLTRFPDGEPQISFPDEFDRKDSVKVICRITSAEELFILTQVGDILDRQEIEWDLFITYLMSMRMDRVMSFNRPFSLKVVCSILNTMNYRYVMILEPHSERTKGLLGTRCYPQKFNFESHLDIQSNIVFPDAGAYQRYKILSNNWGHIVFNKVRDLETGKIREFSIGREVNCYYPTFTFIDDLCDAGGTFLGELKVLKERYPDVKYEIMVCHAVNIKGLVNLCNNFDRVIITNSYCDYGYKPSNNNLTVIDVCG